MGALREIIAKFGVSFDTAELEKGMAMLGKGVGALTKFAGALGVGLTLGALKDFTLGVNDQVLALDKQSRYLRVGIEDLQRWQQAAQIAGVSTDAMNGLLETMRMRSRKPTEAILTLSDRLIAIKDPMRRAQIGTAMLGNSYRDLEPLLEKGRGGIQKLLRESEDLAVVFGKDSVAAAKENRSNLGRLSVVWSGLANQLGAALLPLLVELTKALVPIAVAIKNITHHTALFKAAAIVLSVAGLGLLVSRLGGLRAITGTVITGLKNMLLMLKANRAELGRMALSAAKVIIPLLLLEDFFTFLAGGKSAFGAVIDRVFGPGAQEKVRTFLKVLTGDWETFKEFFGALWDYAADVAVAALFALRDAAVFVGGAVQDALSAMWNGLVDGAKWTVRQLAGVAKAIGLEKISKSVADWESSLDDVKARTDNTEQRQKELEPFQKQLGDMLIKDGDRVARMAAQLASGEKLVADKPNATTIKPVTVVGDKRRGGAQGAAPIVQNTVNVTVPPGTPEQLAKRVGTAAAKAVQQGNAATHAALVQGGG